MGAQDRVDKLEDQLYKLEDQLSQLSNEEVESWVEQAEDDAEDAEDAEDADRLAEVIDDIDDELRRLIREWTSARDRASALSDAVARERNYAKRELSDLRRRMNKLRASLPTLE